MHIAMASANTKSNVPEKCNGKCLQKSNAKCNPNCRCKEPCKMRYKVQRKVNMQSRNSKRTELIGIVLHEEKASRCTFLTETKILDAVFHEVEALGGFRGEDAFSSAVHNGKKAPGCSFFIDTKILITLNLVKGTR